MQYVVIGSYKLGIRSPLWSFGRRGTLEGVTPRCFTHYRENKNWENESLLPRRAGSRRFRFRLISTASVLDECFEPRDNMELKTEYADIDQREYAAKEAVVRFSAEVARWMEA